MNFTASYNENFANKLNVTRTAYSNRDDHDTLIVTLTLDTGGKYKSNLKATMAKLEEILADMKIFIEGEADAAILEGVGLRLIEGGKGNLPIN